MCDNLISTIEINKDKKTNNVLDINSNEFIKTLALFLKEKNIIKVPKYASIVKCGHANDTHPVDQDYFYSKAAAIFRRLYVTKNKNLGIGTLRVLLGKKQRRGVQPPKFFKAGGKLIADIVHQLKSAKYVENYNDEDSNISGLKLTSKGRAELDKIANGMKK